MVAQAAGTVSTYARDPNLLVKILVWQGFNGHIKICTVKLAFEKFKIKIKYIEIWM